ncbi:Rho termination factor N-terminal domain-containing protein [Pseudomonas sp. CDFA 602]|uniref:Rho termination factor N-terminal domain-containing protein n=1 Tax=Pseudomonas californiensis TaxID=2829823 RepID=UPI001E60DCAE|nr:Rho termination factor N-terminal domain-containing protein [Pseudomonas californiensis]MCD5996610.1 Rho termination factor N-terminal domain-containing protein [Pseudomonas californiensis]MCD6002213.1 Rho termination factor N-terminal domain-containing protein [Pseudomonas californiensis]
MPTPNKDKYTDKQKRKAEHIEQGYEEKGVSKGQAEARAWATVNKQSGGGERKGGSGTKTPASDKSAARKDSADKALATRQGKPRNDQSLESQTKVDLMQRARGLKIAGRSTMSKEELITALKKAT